jgi:hypothetical protein
MVIWSYSDCSVLWIYSAHEAPLFLKRFRSWPNKIVSKHRQQQCKTHTVFKSFRINVLSSNSKEITKIRALISSKHLYQSATLLSVKTEEVILLPCASPKGLKKLRGTIVRIYNDYVICTQSVNSMAGEFHRLECKFSFVVLLQTTRLWF